MQLLRPQSRRDRDNDTHLVPLINIVFLLLIFFMLTAKLTQPELFAVTPPASVSPTPAEQQELMVLIAADGRLAVGNREIDAAGLQQLIRARLAEEEEAKVKLKADAQLTAERLISVMEALRGAGVERLILLTTLSDD